MVCKIHKGSGGATLASGYVDIVLPIHYSVFAFKFLYTTTNRTLVDVAFEYCTSLKKLPIFLNLVFEILKKFSSDLIRDCPYMPTKRFGIENFPVDTLNVLLSTFNFQVGNYMAVTRISDRKNKTIFFLTAQASLSRRRKG